MDLLTLTEAAELLRAAPTTLRYCRSTGTGPASAKIGRRIAYRRADVEAWIEQQFETAATTRDNK